MLYAVQISPYYAGYTAQTHREREREKNGAIAPNKWLLINIRRAPILLQAPEKKRQRTKNPWVKKRNYAKTYNAKLVARIRYTISSDVEHQSFISWMMLLAHRADRYYKQIICPTAPRYLHNTAKAQAKAVWGNPVLPLLPPPLIHPAQYMCK